MILIDNPSLNNQISRCSSLEELEGLARECNNCRLRSGCQGVVFGKGSPSARLLFIGEGPGAEEDRLGLPFVGAAGKLLDKIIAAGGFNMNDVYIANIVKCRPPGNRVPAREEAESCRPWLNRQIELINPSIIVLLGSVALQNIIDSDARITRDRGRWVIRDGVHIMPTYHPAALLRDETKKRPVWDDIKQVRDLYQRMISQQSAF